jgi:hypothetical protein
MQRRDHLGFAIRLPHQHGAGAPAAGRVDRTNAGGERCSAVKALKTPRMPAANALVSSQICMIAFAQFFDLFLQHWQHGV